MYATNRAIKPLHVFPTIEEFASRHKAGTEAEFAASEKLVHQINQQENNFQAWVVSKTRQTAKRTEYLLVVQPGPDGERQLPSQNEPAKLRIVFRDDSTTRFWDARRIENPLPFLNIVGRFPDKLAAFQVTVHISEAHSSMQSLVDVSTPRFVQNGNESSGKDSSSSIDWDSGSSRATDGRSSSGAADHETQVTNPELCQSVEEINLTDDNAVKANFLLTASEATKNAEITALTLVYGEHTNATERQIKAFEYFVLLRNPEFVVDLHAAIPHMKNAMTDASWANSPLARKFALLDPQQKAVYLNGFNRLECGICILPGGPGAGKTHFNLFTIAMAQLRPLPRPVRVGSHLEKRHAKVLFIVDMNSPVDDVANRMVRLYDELGMKKVIIRMRGWGSEVKSSGRLNAAEDAASSGEPMQVDFSNQFLRTVNLMSMGHGAAVGRSCQAPSLDEAAWLRYEQYKHAKYGALTKFLEEDLWENNEVLPMLFRRLVYNLYRDTLAAADFIATTPVAASNHFKGMFKPDLVYFDESPHARELSNLIAISNFDPIAWIFCGDYRQTVPFVGSDSPDSTNIYREQMQVSMMERAAAANVIRHELLMNHRAFGGLHQLASTLWYSGRMVSGTEDRATPSLSHTQKYLKGLAPGLNCTVPRLLVHLKDCGPEGRDGTSAWNPSHAKWVMARVWELLRDDTFKGVDCDKPGTILIISPYKKAFHEYRNAIKNLPKWAQQRVETRTVDVAQGHEADFVFLDLVKEKSTKFLDDKNRLCVAITRARLGEIIMMHPNMVKSTTFLRYSENLRRIHTLCTEAGQVAVIDSEETLAMETSGSEASISKNSANELVCGNLTTDTSSSGTSVDGGNELFAAELSGVSAGLEDLQLKGNKKTVTIQDVVPMVVSSAASTKQDIEVEEVETARHVSITLTVPSGLGNSAMTTKGAKLSVGGKMAGNRAAASGKSGPQSPRKGEEVWKSVTEMMVPEKRVTEERAVPSLGNALSVLGSVFARKF